MQQLKLRLEGIDTPEKGQSYGDKARQELGRLVFGKVVEVQTTGTDKYGRTLGRLFVGDIDVSHALVAQGFAWHYVKYSTRRIQRALQRPRRSQRLPLPPRRLDGFWTSCTGARTRQ